MAKCNASYGLGLACFAVAVAMAGATRFQVGGGWSPPAAGAESLNTWAERTRFQIGDSLEFVYPKDKDSVLLVEPADYNACNTSSYVKKFDDGDTVFTLDRSGALFFISGIEAHCRANEKLIVMVLAAGRNGTGGAPAPSTSSSPPPSSPPPASSSPPPPSPPAPTHNAPTTASPPPPGSAPRPASAPTTTPSTPPPAAPASTPPAAPAGAPPPSAASSPTQSAQGTPTNSTGTSRPPAGSDHRNGAALTVAAGLASSLGACVLGYAMLSL
ncbi:early nodulin-like protein 18 [Phragmites australis]|uniref:early nodulin-like protein 18 n=1 Tax=Phragmites australis TaxID=29695 RepID=UPI002D78728A|nr:early nodulin-like protein 18 [Phragmites australis]